MYTNFIKTFTITNINEWVDCLDLPNQPYYKVYSINGYFYVFGSDRVLRSVNGIMWNDEIENNFGIVSGIATIQGRFISHNTQIIDDKEYTNNRVCKVMTLIVGSEGVKCSYDMKTFFDVNTNLPYETITGLCSHNNIFYASSNNGNVYKSSNGEDWTVIEIGYPVNSIDSSANKVFVGTSNGLFVSINDGEFNKFIDEYEIIPENFAGRILAATSSGKCYVSDNSVIYLTDMDEQTVIVNASGDLGYISSIIIDIANGCYVLTSTGLWYNNNEIAPFLQKVMDNTASELGIIFYYNNKIISMGKRAYYDTNAKSQMDVDIPVFTASEVARETIIKQITISNENDEDVIYYDDSGNELDGTGLIYCFIGGDGIAHDGDILVDKFNLIPENYELDTNDSIYVLDKPLILNKGESIMFRSKTPKISITIVYSYGS